jgi:hypothetical protein
MLYELPPGSEVIGENWDDHTYPTPATSESSTAEKYQESLEYLRSKIDRLKTLISSEYNSVVDVPSDRPEIAQAIINLQNYLSSCPELKKEK